MTDLSPATQAVLTAFGKHPLHSDHIANNLIHGALPSAIEALADEVVPEEPMHSFDQRWMYERDTRQSIRSEILAIAAELRGTTTQEDNS